MGDAPEKVDKFVWVRGSATLRQRHPTLTSPQVNVARLLISFAWAGSPGDQRDGWCHLNHQTKSGVRHSILVRETGLSDEGVRQALRRLAELGILQYTPGTGRKNSEIRLLRKAWERPTELVPPDGGGQGPTEPGDPRDQGGAPQGSPPVGPSTAVSSSPTDTPPCPPARVTRQVSRRRGETEAWLSFDALIEGGNPEGPEDDGRARQ
jgi:hypothetical protein